ncbi:MAG: hypothetical protein KIH08_13100, partial [Candidatus Freyarchaeota archaeon]|nr:hypothetical protein [Candidatus Jordarchaeia archaeon]
EILKGIVWKSVRRGYDASLRRDYSKREINEGGLKFFASLLKVLSYEGSWKILEGIRKHGGVSSKDVHNLELNLKRLESHGLIFREDVGRKRKVSLTKLGEKIVTSPIRSLQYLKEGARRSEGSMVLLYLLISGGEESFSELRENLKLNAGSLYRRLNQLVSEGFVLKLADGKYQVRDWAVLEPLKKLYEEFISEYYAMGLCLQENEIGILNLPERSPPAGYGLEYYAPEDVVQNHVVVTYSYESEKPREEIVRRIIYEQTRWKDDMCKPISPKQVGRIEIAYDVNKLASLQQLFNFFCLHNVKGFDHLMVEHVEVPKLLIEKFGLKPGYGITGIRKLLGVYDRPLIHVIIPPYLKDKNYATDYVQKLFEAGIDEVGDDQFIGLGLKEFKERAESLAGIIEESAQNFSNRTLVYLYIEGEDFLEKIDFIKDINCKYLGLGLSPLSLGIPTTIYIRKHYSMPLHLHSTLYGIYTRMGQTPPFYSKEGGYRSGHGISANVILKLFALCGGDEVNIHHHKQYFITQEEMEIQCNILRAHNVFPALVGGITLSDLENVIKTLGKDITIKIGGHRFLEGEQVQAHASTYKKLITKIIQGESEDEEIKRWQKKEKEIMKKDVEFLIGIRKET